MRVGAYIFFHDGAGLSTAENSPFRLGPCRRDPRLVLHVIARRQAGIVTRQQARRAGMTDSAIRQRVLSGRWQRLFPGVFACFSGPVSRPAQLWAAVLFGGPGALLSHETAAELYGLAPEPVATVHISVPRWRRVSEYPGLVVHRSARAETARHPVLEPPRTNIEETVVDLTQAAADPESAVGWLVRAGNSRQTTAGRLRAAIAGRTRVRWRRLLVTALRQLGDGCHSILELRYLRRVEQAHGLPTGIRQRDDIMYPGRRLLVELDGGSARHVLAGFVVLRYAFGEVAERPCVVALEVATALRDAGWPGRPQNCGPECAVRAVA